MVEKEKDEKKVRAALARKASLTPAARLTIAKNAAAARWGAKPIKARNKGSFKDDFGFDVECYVLDDEQKTAIVSRRGIGTALGLGDQGKGLSKLLRGQKVAPYVGDELEEKLANPLLFQWSPPGMNVPGVSHGYDVTILIDVCKAIIAADDGGSLLPRQKHIAKQAHVILNASAKAGIKGLVYALAGYDPTREEVIAAFKFYVREEAREYEKEFPKELYAEWVRLYELVEPPRGKNWKHKDLTVKHVYTPLARSNGKILELARVQKAKSADRSSKLHQFLSVIGVKALRTHLGRLLGMAETSADRATYEAHVSRVFGKQLDLDFSGQPIAP